jgi:inner membrane protein
MPSPLAHSFTAYGILRIVWAGTTDGSQPVARYRVALCILVANAPDLDFIPQIITGVRYHHGISHSLFLVTIVAATCGFLAAHQGTRPRVRWWLTCLAVGWSHLLLDFFTEGGRGMPLLWPLVDDFYQSSWFVFPAIRHSQGLIHSSHIEFMVVETLYSFAIVLLIYRYRQARNTKRNLLAT